MNRKILLIILNFITLNFCSGQDQQKYSQLVKEAENLYDGKEFLKSGQKYSEAFVALGGKGMVNDRYNSACSWALANESDSAFVQLFRIAEKGNYTNFDHIIADTDLNSLHREPRWNEVIAIIKSNKEKADAKLDKPLVATLHNIYQEDQNYRKQLRDIEEKFGRNSDEMKTHWKVINQKDSVNLIQVKKILDQRGWLGSDIIGDEGSITLFLVIQHSDLETQEKYLPMMREAVKRNNANAGNLALLEDRVALRKGQKQIYGSQIGQDKKTGEYYMLPLIDPDNVDKRRQEVGLQPIQDYVSQWKIVWNSEEYKKKLPEYEAMQKH